MNKLQILVVEDDKSVRNLMSTTLKAHDYKYIVAENGEEAILQASTYNPDIALLDLGLPDMDGVEVIKKIRSWSNMPIIVISARSEDSDKIEALDNGADDYFLWILLFEKHVKIKYNLHTLYYHQYNEKSVSSKSRIMRNSEREMVDIICKYHLISIVRRMILKANI